MMRRADLLVNALLLATLALSSCWAQLVKEGGAQSRDAAPPKSCHSWANAVCDWEPNLKPMVVDFGQFNETFYAYVTPDVSTFYNETPGTRKPAPRSFTGIFAKFINLSPDKVRVFWIPPGQNQAPLYISDVEPFGSAGTASFYGHVFRVTPFTDHSKKLIDWTIKPGESNYYYDSFGGDYSKAMKALTSQQLTLYHMQVMNKIFAEQYKKFTGTDWLALYREKHPPRYHMWRADSFGQTHQVETSEIHFVERPPSDELERGTSPYGPRPDEMSRVRRYRDRLPTMNMTLTVLSCEPRVFEIRNFLSEVEVDHILHIAKTKKMYKSTTRAGEGSEAREDSSTRTSTQNWIPRHSDLMIDAIYRRAADLLRIPEALLRWRNKNEIPEFSESAISIAERLQLVHYDVGQQYTAHHDFTMPSMVHLQPSRFATILFYLNDVPEGGETAFPQWLNAETGNQLKVKPEKGKAVLFYSLLPDGNYDTRSQHAALPVLKGEKFLTNLWLWDPLMDHTVTQHL